MVTIPPSRSAAGPPPGTEKLPCLMSLPLGVPRSLESNQKGRGNQGSSLGDRNQSALSGRETGQINNLRDLGATPNPSQRGQQQQQPVGQGGSPFPPLGEAATPTNQGVFRFGGDPSLASPSVEKGRKTIPNQASGACAGGGGGVAAAVQPAKGVVQGPVQVGGAGVGSGDSRPAGAIQAGQGLGQGHQQQVQQGGGALHPAPLGATRLPSKLAAASGRALHLALPGSSAAPCPPMVRPQ